MYLIGCDFVQLDAVISFYSVWTLYYGVLNFFFFNILGNYFCSFYDCLCLWLYVELNLGKTCCSFNVLLMSVDLNS